MQAFIICWRRRKSSSNRTKNVLGFFCQTFSKRKQLSGNEMYFLCFLFSTLPPPTTLKWKYKKQKKNKKTRGRRWRRTIVKMPKGSCYSILQPTKIITTTTTATTKCISTRSTMFYFKCYFEATVKQLQQPCGKIEKKKNLRIAAGVGEALKSFHQKAYE